MSSISSLTGSVRAALAISVAGGVLLVPAAVAGQSDDNPAVQPERIQVTGSRILRAGAEAPAPVTVITGDEILNSGAMNLGEVLSRLPALGNTMTLANSGNSIGNAGISLLDLRGMGTNRTLVLVDGRRHVAGSANSAAVDTNTIPSSWIDRVEIITGGASAVYGADAVTGVVNFILKKNIEGLDITATKGWAENNPYENERFTLSYGQSYLQNRGNIAFSAEYNSQNSLNAMDHQYAGRSWASMSYESLYGPRADDQLLSPEHPDRVRVPDAGYYDFSEAGNFNLNNTWYTFNDDGTPREVMFNGPIDPRTGYCTLCDYINMNQYVEMQPKYERMNFNVRNGFELTPNLYSTLEAKYVRTDGQSIGQPFFSYGGVRTRGDYAIQRDNAFVGSELGALMDEAGASELNIGRMYNDGGRRLEDNTRETMRLVAALDGYLTDDWSFDASLVWGKTDVERVNNNNLITQNYLYAIDAVDLGDGPVCRSEDARAEGCIATSIFGANAIGANARDYIYTSSLATAEVEQKVATFNVQNPFLFDLPAGYAGFAGGVEYRDESAKTIEDPRTKAGETFFNALGETDGSFDVTEVYAELSMPLITDAPFMRDLTLETAVRFADYSTIGNATSWKAGLEWVINTELRTRFTVSEALRAPNITELYRSSGQSFANVDDPCRVSNLDNLTENRRQTRAANCVALGVASDFDDNYDSGSLELEVGGNPALEPEESRSYTAGIIYQPEWLNGFSATVDYWQIDITDTIASNAAQQILNACVDANSINNEYCGRISRNNDSGQVELIESYSLNIARSENRGIDFELGYDFNALAGNIRTTLIGTKLLEAKRYPFTNQPDDFIDYAGVLGDADLQMRFTVDYSRDNWTIGTRTRYSNSVNLYNPDELAGNPNPNSEMSYGSYAVTDLTLGYRYENGVRARVGIDNLFDKKMPGTTNGTGTGSAYYDNIGRFLYVSLGYSF